MTKQIIKDFGFATLHYHSGQHHFYVLETKEIKGVIFSNTYAQYFPVKPTQRQVRKTLNNISKQTKIRKLEVL